MSIEYIKKAPHTVEINNSDLTTTVQDMLTKIKTGGEESARRYAKELDQWQGEIVVSEKTINNAIDSLSEKVKDDIRFAHNNIRRFAEAQKNTISDCTIEIVPGFEVGQKNIPVSNAGCYIPGGRYSHIASAMMTVTTAKVAGVNNIIACSPPKPGVGISAPVLFALKLCGADVIDRKSTRLNSSHVVISYAVFCLKQKTPSLWPHSRHRWSRGSVVFRRPLLISPL